MHTEGCHQRVHILSEPLKNQNTRAFLFPLLRHRRCLLDAGVSLRIFYDLTPDLADCDVLVINNKWLTPLFASEPRRALDLVEDWAQGPARLLYFDRSSTAGSLEPDVVPLVDAYYKTSLFRDRGLYTRPVYCGRLFCEHYHQNYGVADTNPAPSAVLSDPTLADRLSLSWNTGLADYTVLGPRLMALYGRVPITALLSGPSRMTPPSRPRPIGVSCRMNLDYIHESIGFQRQRMAQALKAHRRSERLSKPAYFRELRRSQIVASPFGTSEINYKDFEVFLTGGALLKPDMSHLETWPDFYVSGTTFAAHDWDLGDLTEVIEDLMANPDRRIAIAEAGQQRYREHICGNEARDRFVRHFLKLLQPVSRLPGQAVP